MFYLNKVIQKPKRRQTGLLLLIGSFVFNFFWDIALRNLCKIIHKKKVTKSLVTLTQKVGLQPDVLICSAPFAADTLPGRDLSQFEQLHREKSSPWQGEFLAAGGSNVGHARHSLFSLTQPSVIVGGEAQESLSCELAECYSITPLSIQSQSHTELPPLGQ